MGTIVDRDCVTEIVESLGTGVEDVRGERVAGRAAAGATCAANASDISARCPSMTGVDDCGASVRCEG